MSKHHTFINKEAVMDATIEIIELLSDEELEQMVFGTHGCSIGSVPNTCQAQSNKF